VSPITEYMVQTGLTLVGVGMLGYLLVFAVRRANGGRPKGPLELLGTLRLEQRRAIYLVRIAERTVVLGASEGGMVTVMELDPKELGDVTTKPASPPFRDILSRMLTSPPARKPRPMVQPSAIPSATKDPREPDTSA
jgi:flagellar biogenesis protein FliO